MNIDEALEVARDLENHDSADYPKAAAVLAAEVWRLREVADAAEKWRRAPIRGSRRAAARNRLHAALDALAVRRTS